MSFWTLSGRNLQTQIGELTLPRTFTNVGGGVFSHEIQNQGRFGLALVCDEIDPTLGKTMKNDEELENIYVTFLSIGFLKTTIVASGDDGFVSHHFVHSHSYTSGRMKGSSGGYLLMRVPYSPSTLTPRSA